VSDFIIQSELGADLILPVNKEYSDFFRKDRITVLGLTVRNQEYLDENELDNNSIFLHTDVFGFLSDLLDVQWGNGFWVRAKDDFSRLRDPLDTEIRLLRQQGLTPVKNFHDFARTENTANLDVGWKGSQLDAAVGYENYHLWLDDEDLLQAEHVRHNWHAEVGMPIPEFEKQRGFIRGDYWTYNFARAPVRNDDGSVAFHEQRLNDARVYRGVLGAEGPVYNDRLHTRVESGYESWVPGDEAAGGGDRNQFHHWVGLAQIQYQPWEELKDTKVLLQYRRTVGYSAISNFNAVHEGLLQLKHGIIPDRLDADFSISFTSTVPSDGPRRKLLETGVGATYHLYKQVDLSLRYVFRHQTASDEIVTNSAFGRGSRLFEYSIESNGDFYQNIVELALLLHF
jgi:hypothetical protein